MVNKAKNKLINTIMVSGNKKTSEKILLKSIKRLQKKSKKQTKNIIQLSLINFISLFKFHEISNKKLKKKQRKVKIIPSFLATNAKRTFLSIKYLIEDLDKKTKNPFFVKLYQKILTLSNNPKFMSDQKPEILIKHLTSKKHLKNYRW